MKELCVSLYCIKNKFIMADVNFTIGGEFGKMLYNVAVEKVLEDMNPEEGIRVITDGLIGCPTQYAILVIKGEYFLDTDGNCNVCITDDYNELTNPYTPRSIDGFIKDKAHYYINQIDDWKHVLGNFKNSFPRDNVFIMAKLSASRIFKYFMGDSYIEDVFEDSTEDNNVFIHTKYVTEGVKNCMKEVQDCMTYFRKMNKIFSVDTKEYIDRLEMQASSLRRCIVQIYDMGSNRTLHSEDNKSDLIDSFIESTRKIDESLNNGIKPVNITDKYDACWIAPDGTVYGLNGEYANMLHLTIAEALVNEGIVSYEDDDNGAYGAHYLLEKKGFVKVHFDTIYFSGYEKNINKKLTPEQVNQLVKYGETCYGGKLYTNYDKKFCSTAKLKSMDPLMYYKLFEW